jgi:hypothetical protein
MMTKFEAFRHERIYQNAVLLAQRLSGFPGLDGRGKKRISTGFRMI